MHWAAKYPGNPVPAEVAAVATFYTSFSCEFWGGTQEV